MNRTAIARRRMKVSVTVDPALLQAVDAFVRAHPSSDRSKIVDEALALWYRHQQEQSMEEQFAESPNAEELAERASWRDLRRASALRAFGGSYEK